MLNQPESIFEKAARPRWWRRSVFDPGVVPRLGGRLVSLLPKMLGDERGLRADVFIGKADRYEADLAGLILAGFAALSVSKDDVRGRRILLKPNLVETAQGQSHINTNPAVVLAAAEAFFRLDAAEVVVAEGQGHRSDSWIVLEESGMRTALSAAKLPFVDLNHDDVAPVPNKGGATGLSPLFLPRTLLGADLIVSMPKLKTHHWTGVTCSMKNLFGVMPGVVYGWPKNLLHYAGIDRSIVDINATVRPHLTIADGIVGMEGDGPIMGTPKQLGCLVIGRNLPAVDATCVRLMELNPFGIGYLVSASGRLGPICEEHITQRGETIAANRSPFRQIDVPHLRSVSVG